MYLHHLLPVIQVDSSVFQLFLVVFPFGWKDQIRISCRCGPFLCDYGLYRDAFTSLLQGSFVECNFLVERSSFQDFEHDTPLSPEYYGSS